MSESPLLLSVAERIDALCDQFEEDFRAGRKPAMEDFLSQETGATQPALFRALLELDIELRLKVGETPKVVEYVSRFPHQAQAANAVFAALTPTQSDLSSIKATGIETSLGRVRNTKAAEPSAEILLPSTLGCFEIKSVLGEGAFGTVYRARDPQLDRDVAIKVPKFAGQQSREDRERFLREARAAGCLQHAHICPVHEVGTVDGRDYIVLAFIDGKPLSTVLQANPKLTERQIVGVIRKLAAALQEAHDQGIIHRDLKPANIMITRKGEPMIMDFGLARRANSSDAQISQSGQIMGTPAHMSPEQARGDGKAVGPATDIYSLGIMLYEMLCGRRPFDGTVTEVIGKILHVEPPPPAQFRSDVDERLQAICLKAIAKEPGNRFASMKDLAKALDATLRPAMPAAEVDTARATKTQEETSEDARPQLTDIIAALSHEHKVQSANTAAALEAAVSRSRTPSWVWSALVLTMLGGFLVLGGVMFFTRSSKVRVTVVLKDIDLTDKTLSFLLDERQISAEELAKKIELEPGTHMLVVKRGADIVKRIVLEVRGGWNPGIDILPMDEKTSPLDHLRAEDIPDAMLAKTYGGRDKAPVNLVAIYANLGRDSRDDYFGFEIGPNGQTLAMSRYPWDMIEMLNLANGRRYQEIGIKEPRNANPFFTWVKIAPDGSLYGLRKDQDLYHFAATGAELWRMPIRGNWSKPGLSPDGKIIVAADSDKGKNLLHVIDAQTGKELSKWADLLVGPNCRIQFSPDGQTVAVHSASHVKLVNPKDGSVLKSIDLSRAPGDPIFSRNGKKLYTSHHWQVLEDYIVETDLATKAEREYRLPPKGCRTMLVNPKYPILVSSDSEKRLHFWDEDACPKQTPYMISLECPAEQYQFTPDGRYLVVGCDHGIFVFRLPVEHKVSSWSSHLAKAKAEPQSAIAPFDSEQARKYQEQWAEYLGVPVEYTNSIDMKFRLIPPGEYLRGTADSEKWAVARTFDPKERPALDLERGVMVESESPQHAVRLTSARYLAVTEVTQQQYRIIIGSNPASMSTDDANREFGDRVRGMDTANFPVDGVSWMDAERFCDRLSQKEEIVVNLTNGPNEKTIYKWEGYRLPTEAEWEFACRAGTTTTYWNGNDDREVHKIAWLISNTGGRTHAVGELPANPFGLHDMHGNLWEWVQDGWDSAAYQQCAKPIAIDPFSPTSNTAYRMIRGGVWSYSSSHARSASRIAIKAEVNRHHPGFRVSLSVDAVKKALGKP